MSLVGKVLWWDACDGNGVIIDPAGNEYYFDSSVLSRGSKAPKASQYVLFEVNPAIRGTACAHKVRLSAPSKSHVLERQFSRRASELAA